MNNVQLLSHQTTVTAPLNKPLELYIFIDPLCPEAYTMQAMFRKLQLEYEQYFTWRYVLSTNLSSLNCCSNRMKDTDTGDSLDVSHPVLPSIAIKAAELQGKRAGSRYLSKLQEYAVLDMKNVNSYATLIEIANEVNLDMQEFENDFGSKDAARAFQCDLYITREMGVNEVPSIVFFNECIEDEGLKVSGNYSYEVYEQILQEMISDEIVRQPLPTLDCLFDRFHSLTTAEVAEIYSMDPAFVERELKKRMLQQKVERVVNEDTTVWRIK